MHIIAHPEKDSPVVRSIAPGSRLKFDFDASEAVFDCEGDSLILKFPDGASIKLKEFYSRFDRNHLPPFIIDGEEVDTYAFLASFGSPDLIPAEEPMTPTTPNEKSSNRFHDYDAARLLAGINHLGPLDYSSRWGYEHDEIEHTEPVKRDEARQAATVAEPAAPPVIPLPPALPLPPAPIAIGEAGMLFREGDPDDPRIKTGEIPVSAPDGVKGIVFADIDLPLDGTPVEVSTDSGKLTAHYEPNGSGGKIIFTFEFTGRADHPDPGSDSVILDFPLEVTGPDGQKAETTVKIEIVDDLPEAVDDRATLYIASQASVSGNVVPNDDPGADGFGSMEWDPHDSPIYGEIVRNLDGTWEYRIDPENPAIKALGEGETLIETFRYRLYDGDGDFSDAILTITIFGKKPAIIPPDELIIVPENPVPDPDDSDLTASAVTVREQDLKDGHPVDSGSFLIRSSKGVAGIAIGGMTVWTKADGILPDVALPTDEGFLRVISFDESTGRLTYSFTLEHATGEHQAQGRDAIYHSFDVVVTDADDKTASSKIIANVIDDIPEIEAPEGVSVFCGDAVAIPDLLFDFGADGGGKLVIAIGGRTIEISDPSSEWSIEGAYGVLNSYGSGHYSYEAHPVDEDALGESIPDQMKDSFSFTLIDSDGDETRTEWAVSVKRPEYIGITEVPEVLKRPLRLGEADADGIREILPHDGYDIMEISDPSACVFNEGGKWFFRPDGEGMGDAMTVWFRRQGDGADFEIRVPALSGGDSASSQADDGPERRTEFFFEENKTRQRDAYLGGNPMRTTIDTATAAFNANDDNDFGVQIDGQELILADTEEPEKKTDSVLDEEQAKANDTSGVSKARTSSSWHAQATESETASVQLEAAEVAVLEGVDHLEGIDSVSDESALSDAAADSLSLSEEAYFRQDAPATRAQASAAHGEVPASTGVPETVAVAGPAENSGVSTITYVIPATRKPDDEYEVIQMVISKEEPADDPMDYQVSQIMTESEIAEAPAAETRQGTIHFTMRPKASVAASPAITEDAPMAEEPMIATAAAQKDQSDETFASNTAEMVIPVIDPVADATTPAAEASAAERKAEELDISASRTDEPVATVDAPVAEAQEKTESEAPVSSRKEEIRETSTPKAEEAVASGNAPVADAQEATEPEAPVSGQKEEYQETSVDRTDKTEVEAKAPVIESQDNSEISAPAIDPKDEIRETSASGPQTPDMATTDNTSAVDAQARSDTDATVTDPQARTETTDPEEKTEESAAPVTESKSPAEDDISQDKDDPKTPVTSEKTDGSETVTTTPETNSETPVPVIATDPASQADPEPDPEPSHTFKSTINLPEGVVDIIRVVKQGKYGEIVQRDDGEWVYQLNSAINSGDEQGSNRVPEADAVYVMILDTRGNKLRTKITVSIIDDVPELDVKGDEELASGSVFTGKIAYTYGADYIDYDDHDPKHIDVKSGVETASVNDFESPIVIRGNYGVLTIKPNGQYTYKANPLLHGQEGGTDTFTFSITDADGDTVTKNLDGSPAELTFKVEKPADPDAPVISEVYEKTLPDGTEPGDPSSTVTIPEGYELIVKEGGDHPGHLEKSPDGSWKYVLDKPIDSGDEQGPNRVGKGDTQTVILRDKDGNEWEYEVPVAIVDDAPEAEDDSNSITKGEESVISTGSVLDNDKYGADREADIDAFVWNTGDLATDENGRYVLEYGSIELNADGTYTYYLDNANHDVITLTDGKSLYDSLTYTITDSDGDTATATLTIEIKGKDNGITVTPKDPDKDPDPVPDPDDKRDPDPDPTPDPTDPDQPDPDIPVEPRDPDDPDNPEADPDDPSTQAAVEQIKERELRSGDPVKRHGDLEIEAPDGVASIIMNGEELIDGQIHTFKTEIGTLSIRYDRESETGGRLKYEYILDGPADHGKETSAYDKTDIVNDIFKFTVKDSDGTEASSRIIIRVIDDVPLAADDFASVGEGAKEAISGNVLTGDAEGKGKDEYGADGKASADSLVWNGLVVDDALTAPDADGTIQGQYGIFRPGEDGNWTYELDNTNAAVQGLRGEYTDEDGVFHEAETLTEVIRYTIKDADSDTSIATLTITIVGASGDPSITPDEPDPEIPGDPDKPVDPDDPKTQGALITVHEKNLSDGTAPDAARLTVEGTMEIEAPDGVKSLHVGDQEIALDGTATTLKIGGNTLTLSYSAASGTAGTLSYSFTLSDELSHKDGESLLEELLSKYQITLTDLEGKTAKSALHVKVMDDAPEMELDEDIELESGDEVDVEFSFTVGADNGDGKKLVVTFKNEDGTFVKDAEGNLLTVEIDDPNSAWEIKGQFGTLTRHEDGTYTYKADPFDEDALGETLDGDEYTLPDQVKDTFTFTLIDADGDSTGPEDWTATISKPEYGGDTEVPEALKRPLITYEADLVDGNPVYEITVPDGYEIIDVYGSPAHGEVFEQGGKWYYKLTEEIDSGDIQGSNWVKNVDSFTIWVERIEDGADFEVNVPVTIVDDVPEIESSSHKVGAGKTLTGEIAHDFGADTNGKLVLLVDGEQQEIGEDGLELAGEHGTLMISSDGKWAYQANAGAEGTDSFDLRVIDGDGDTAEASLTLEVRNMPFFGEQIKSDFEIGVTKIHRSFEVGVHGTVEYWDESASGDLAGFIDINEPLDSSVTFTVYGTSMTNLSEDRISFHFEKNQAHPAGDLVIE